MRVTTYISIVLCSTAAACAHTPPPAAEPSVAGPPALRVDAGNPRSQAVWRAVLERYASGTIVSKAAALLEANGRAGGAGPQSRARMVLIDSQGHPYARGWLDSLVAARLIDGVCAGPSPQQCPDTVATSFVSFADPDFSGDTAVDVAVDDQALDRGACHRRGARMLGGFIRAVFHLARHQGPWQLIESQTAVAGDYFC
jgi:hypothetical protein